ncbi:hypothetical protein [Grimontia hollisae]|uniref:hypothetical protein n=1 Tax=Grimontia hollisae TaxID=673 RepID=UPI0012AC9C33|nr:hypothetical protein [Grimontia hollisae]MDF2185613.1 hypothetical protein [Grimontia hollisae]
MSAAIAPSTLVSVLVQSISTPEVPEGKRVEIRSISQQAPSENSKSILDKISSIFSFLAMK